MSYDVKYFIKKYWWLRGAGAALSIAALSQSYMNMNYRDSLRGIHASITASDLLASRIGSAISYIPFLPHFTGSQISAIVLILSSIMPLTILLWNDIQETDSRFEIIFRRILALGLGITQSVALFDVTANRGDPVFHGTAWSIVMAGVVMSCFCISGYFRGFVHIVCFIVTIEILYLLSLPIISDSIKKFSCEAIPAEYEGC